MSREAVIFGVAGTVFGLLLGWIIGSQQGPVRSAPAATTAAAPGNATPNAPPDQAKPIDLQRASALEKQAKAQPSDVSSRVDLGNLYQDAQRPDLAIPWYEQALKLNPKDVNVSTDLAVCYYYTDQSDKALAQIDKSLAIDPKHPPTLLNQGIIRAFGKQDLQGALESWQKVVEYAPNSPEAARAKEGIEGLQSAHGKNQPGGGRGGL
jgi:tetratricopeptide (TPR) repeat protein